MPFSFYFIYFSTFNASITHMVSRSSCKRSSLYDSLPVLDSWYQQDDELPAVPPITTPTKVAASLERQRPSAGSRRSVSFSADPPSIHYIDEDSETALPEQRRHHHHGGARMKSLAKRLLPKQFSLNKVYAIPSTTS
ncbi:hypothetical protein BJV82DRAFT_614470 [Fennellomyces sp. T-0311]|nr:hypothetical protein BJV82DRAFT_614470 [Fennellomyces sp. T-0311]